MADLSAAFKRTNRATRKAFERVRKSTGQAQAAPDEDVALYRTLTPLHFRVLRAKYGDENIDRYINTMERRING